MMVVLGFTWAVPNADASMLYALEKPYEFTVGAQPGKERKRDFVDNPNGLFSAQAAPKPPPAMYTVVEGMRVGGKVIQMPFLILILL